MLPNPNNRKSADSYNRTLGVEQEYKVNKVANVNSIDMALRTAAKQANDIVLVIESDISLGNLGAAINDRVRRCENITHVTIMINNKDVTYTREDIVANGFKIQQADLK